MADQRVVVCAVDFDFESISTGLHGFQDGGQPLAGGTQAIPVLFQSIGVVFAVSSSCDGARVKGKWWWGTDDAKGVGGRVGR